MLLQPSTEIRCLAYINHTPINNYEVHARLVWDQICAQVAVHNRQVLQLEEDQRVVRINVR
jgi:hypothetical protein